MAVSPVARQERGAPCPSFSTRPAHGPGRFAIAVVAWLVAASTSAQVAPSPAEQQIASAEKEIAAHSAEPQPRVDLGWALARRARESGDPSFYARAEDQASAALKPDPANFEARKLSVWVLLGKHEFARALDEATALNLRVPDDVMVYGFLADANAELGNYEAAEKAVQWMLDVRPGNLSGLTRAAYLREVFGDVEGALDAYSAALTRMAPTEIEDRAWILGQMGLLLTSVGRHDDASTVLEQALGLFPGYHYALNAVSQVRTAQNRQGEAVALLRQLCAAAPHPEHLYKLAEALHRAGNAEATAVYAEFEKKALAESASNDNANRELVFYYTDRAGNAGEALRLSLLERARRHDVHTLDAHAWALSASGRQTEARREIEEALAVGIRDAAIFYHAGAIALKAGDPATARKYPGTIARRESGCANRRRGSQTARRDRTVILAPSKLKTRLRPRAPRTRRSP